MMADDFVEAAKQQAQQGAEIIVPAVTDRVKAGAGAMMDIMKGVASMPASALANHFMHGNHQTSLATLQRQMGGDLHPLAIAPELERYLKADLRRRGVNFSLEKAPDGNTYVHFSGRDVDTVQHGLKQSAARYERRVAKVNSTSFKREVKARKKVNKVMNKQSRKVSKSLAKSQKAAVKATNAQVRANNARYKANKQLGVVAQSSPEKRARAIKKYMRLSARANKKQLKANTKGMQARSASMNFWQTQYRANDKISRAQYKALTRIDRARKWRMKKLKQQPFNQGLPQPMPQQGLPGQPVPPQPMPQPMPQEGLPGQALPQPIPQQPVPQQGLPGQPVPGQPMPQQSVPQPMPGQPVPGQPMPQPMPQEGLPGQAWLTPEVLSQVPRQPMPQQALPQPVNQPVPQRAPQPVPGQRAPKGAPGQPKYSKADVTKAMDQRKQQILEEAKKAKPTRSAPTHSKGAR